MAFTVRYLGEEAIERDANDLLGEYGLARGVSITAPIPVEQLLEFHLGLSLDFDDLHGRLGIPLTGDEPDVLGALWVDSREVFVDQSLDPEDRPWLEGRYRYTLGHEVGHWQLHRDQLGVSAGQGSLFSRESEPTIVCRKSQAKERIEWQADYFASVLLMPRALVMAAWRDRFGDAKPRIVRRRRHPRQGTPSATGDLDRALARFTQNQDDATLEQFARPLADDFEVSAVAMRIRLEQLSLLHRQVPRQGRLSGGSYPTSPTPTSASPCRTCSGRCSSGIGISSMTFPCWARKCCSSGRDRSTASD